MSNNIVPLKDRLTIALEYRNMRPIDLSEKTGIPKSAISQYMSGYAKPKDDRVYLISRALDINEGWLLGFNVPMERIPSDYTYTDNQISIPLVAENIQGYVQSGEIRLMTYYLKHLNNKGREEALKRIEELTHIPTYTIESEEELEAAHSIEGASQEDKDHDNDIMNNF